MCQPLLLLFVLAFLLPVLGRAVTSSDEQITALLRSNPVVQKGHIGYKFISLNTGEVLAEKDSATLFTPASNAKLYTTAMALVRLGPDYTFHTEVRTGETWTPGQTIVNDLLLIGGGDPNLSGRPLPYLADSPDGDSLLALRQLADQVVQAGIREVQGDIIGADTRYPGDPYPDGWTLDDSLYSYGAPVSALVLNDNAVALILRPSQTGELAVIEMQPSSDSFIVLNQVITDDSPSSHISLRRPPGSNEVIVGGTISKSTDQWREDLGIPHPAFFAAEMFTDLLRERGITVRGEPRSEYRNVNDTSGDMTPAHGTLVTTHESLPLSETLRVINKVSQNLHAEMLLREVAFCRTGEGTLENGVKERENFLQEAGVTREGTGFALADGSGLARQDLTTPDSTVALLRYMWGRPEREDWLRSLPIGGLDGSLQNRFHQTAGSYRVHAKTGSLSHVNALSGYLETRQHGWIAFSVMVNATVGPEKQVRELIDRLCSIFLE